MRTICYIDGFNLYYGLREANLRHLYWLNVRAMAAQLVSTPYRLAGTRYFTARISGSHPDDSPEQAEEREKTRLRQTTYLEALGTLHHLDIFEGQFLLKRATCQHCRRKMHLPEEKMTDVCIATELMQDAFLDRFDSAIVVSADSDLVPPIEAIRRHFPDKPVLVAFPPRRFSQRLQIAATYVLPIWRRTLERSQLPETLHKRDGTVLRRPAEWA